MSSHRVGPRFVVRRSLSAGGFTFIELVLVLGILALLVTFSLPNLEGLTPKYRLRTAARKLASQLEDLRVTAISRERWMGIHYVFNNGGNERPYYRVIPPAPLEDPNQPLRDRRMLSKKYLPTGVRFAEIILAGQRSVAAGTLDIAFSPTGNVGSHIVVLTGDDRRVYLKFNCITGIMEYSEKGEVAFEHFEQ
jgi:hypothetical protein